MLYHLRVTRTRDAYVAVMCACDRTSCASFITLTCTTLSPIACTVDFVMIMRALARIPARCTSPHRCTFCALTKGWRVNCCCATGWRVNCIRAAVNVRHLGPSEYTLFAWSACPDVRRKSNVQASNPPMFNQRSQLEDVSFCGRLYQQHQ